MKKTRRYYLNRKESKDYEAVHIYQLISQMKIAQSGHVTSELTQESRLRRAHTWGLKFYGCHPEILDNCVMGMVFCIGGPLGQGSLCQGFRVLAHTQSCHCPQMRLGTLLPCPLPPQGLQASPAHSC